MKEMENGNWCIWRKLVVVIWWLKVVLGVDMEDI